MPQKVRSLSRLFADAVATWQEADFPLKRGRFAELKPLLEVITGRPLTDNDYARLIAELLTCCNTTVSVGSPFDPPCQRDLYRILDVFAGAGIEALAASGEYETAEDAEFGDSGLEEYLREHAPRRRAELGVFFTPEPLARYAVRKVHDTLREKLGLADGLADTTTWAELSKRHRLQLPRGADPAAPFVSILEPAAGSGVFLVAAIDLIYETLHTKWEDESRSHPEATRLWNDYVAGLLPRLTAFELLPAACASAQLNVTRRLLETEYRFKSDDRLSCFVVNALLDPADLLLESHRFNEQTTAALARLHRALANTTYTVVLGNPPFRGVSGNTVPWMQRLLRGEGPDGNEVASYYDVERKPLGERKLWLQDDYVKFLRYAQWQIERANVGVVGFVTNHGYLDNTTFRGVRHAMQETFDSIDILDLHGNRKKGERNPDGGSDESVFDIEQGIAVGVFARSFQSKTSDVFYREAWGSRDEKLAQIKAPNGCKPARLSPTAPHFLFVPCSTQTHPEYEAGLPINEVMPVNSTAVVTARDSFVVAFTEEELLARMRVFRDLDISDTEIRARFFTRGRSNKYPPGDTRGWKLTEARRRMMQDPDWDKHVRPCDYRPFDRRVIYWADWMVDWPRTDVMCHMTQRENMALVTRRQVPTSAACDYFWLSNLIAIDGFVRSDNRGSESVFPLFLVSGDEANLSADFTRAVEEATGLKWNPEATELHEAAFGPYSAFCYIYALFNSVLYRTRYAAGLRQDFPRVLLPKGLNLWRRLAELGNQLVEAVLQRDVTCRQGNFAGGVLTTQYSVPDSDVVSAGALASIGSDALRNTPANEPLSIARGFPNYKDGAIWLSDEGPSFRVPEAVWRCRVGTYQVCRKWVRDRKPLRGFDLARYEQLLGTICRMQALTASIDDAIATAGGPADAFLS